jgi:hypothetical protein
MHPERARETARLRRDAGGRRDDRSVKGALIRLVRLPCDRRHILFTRLMDASEHTNLEI